MTYDEAFIITRAGPTFFDLYKRKGRVFGDDPASLVWIARLQFDIDAGGDPEQMLAKHAQECADALGIPLHPSGGSGDIGVLPPLPSRDQVCGVQLLFEGQTITTAQYGTQPWFEPAYQTLISADDRASVRQQKRAAGDRHLILEYFTHAGLIYPEPNQVWKDAVSRSGEQESQWFRGLVREVIVAGFIPIVAFDGDNGEAGHINALRQLPGLVALLAGLHGYILYARLWDGVFYGSTPQQIAEFGRAFRALLPNGHLAIEHQPGRIPTGEGDRDWLAGGAMTTYDVLLSEFNSWPLGSPAGDQVWQIGGRLLGPRYKRPPNQPAADDPRPPWYLREGNPRGRYFPVAFETTDEYRWVRGGVTAATCLARRQYFRDLGWEFAC